MTLASDPEASVAPDTVALGAKDQKESGAAKFHTEAPVAHNKAQKLSESSAPLIFDTEQAKTQVDAKFSVETKTDTKTGKAFFPLLAGAETEHKVGKEIAYKSVSQNIVEGRLSEIDQKQNLAAAKENTGGKPEITNKSVKQPQIETPLPQRVGAETKTLPIAASHVAAVKPQIPAEPEMRPHKTGVEKDGQTLLGPLNSATNSATPVANPWNMTQIQQMLVPQNASVLVTTEKAEAANDALPLLSSSDKPHVTPHTATVAPTTAGPETARHVASQIAVAIRAEPGRATEIVLNPPELGRVKLSLKAVDGVITLNVAAERQETIDLMRRHIDTLTQEFKSLGYNDISFSFSEREEAEAEDAPSNDGDQLKTDDLQPKEGKQTLRPAIATTGLDLRL
ncbi:flagellar hook-length control protein FliK [Yoonia sediminilitoris]|uniref:flagellar hook-length control protein FliK n=1 Tax=Yoonia sediminilitoris TaxID=1286148 RepID=UPI001455A456|nr:flagellar hook-length control protein FliK [Yoonia sediminilitoris]